ncbi:DUF7739 domain-containing protein [Streptomyces xantholiticus]
MGINVSHGSDLYGEERRSATTIHNLGKHLANVLPSGDWAAIRDLFDGSVSTPVTIEPGRARVIAAILRRGAAEWRMPRDWEQEAGLFADAADRAADAGQPWTWT